MVSLNAEAVIPSLFTTLLKWQPYVVVYPSDSAMIVRLMLT